MSVFSFFQSILDSTFDLQLARHNFTQNFVLIGKLEILKFRGLEFEWQVGHRVGYVSNILLHVWVVNHSYDDVELFLWIPLNTIQIGASKIARISRECRTNWGQLAGSILRSFLVETMNNNTNRSWPWRSISYLPCFVVWLCNKFGPRIQKIGPYSVITVGFLISKELTKDVRSESLEFNWAVRPWYSLKLNVERWISVYLCN